MIAVHAHRPVRVRDGDGNDDPGRIALVQIDRMASGRRPGDMRRACVPYLRQEAAE